MDLAAAGQPASPARHLVRHDQPARLRPDAARPRVRELRGPGGAVRAPAERLDRAGRRLGCRPGRAGADPDSRRDQRQHRRLLGAARRCRRPASRSTSPTRFTGRATGTVPAGKGWVVQTRRGRGFARKADGDIQYVVDFDGPALRSLRRDAPTSSRSIWVDANAEVPRTQPVQEPGHRRLAHDRSHSSATMPPSRSSCAPTCKQATIDIDRDMELHPSRGGRTSRDAADCRTRRSRAARCPPCPGPARRGSGRCGACSGALPSRARARRASDARPLMARRLVLLVAGPARRRSSARRRWPRCCPSAARRSPSAACSCCSASSSRGSRPASGPA